jgi:putative FmdB family regulatory protein
MPLYEYHCEECGNRFEILQRLGEGAEGLNCPRCGFNQVEKRFSTFAANSGGDSGPMATSAPMGGCCQGTST